jgi:Protein of unknown function (DUF3040)
MLTERERRELEMIEQELSADRRFVASFAPGFGHRFRSQLVRPRSLVVFGVLVMVVAVLLGLSDTFVQGLVLTVLGMAWWAWITQAPSRGGPPRTTVRRR